MVFTLNRLRAALTVVLCWMIMGLFAATLGILPFRFLARLLGRSGPPGASPPGVDREKSTATAVRVAIMRAVRLAPFRSDCLPQALCASLLCRMRGVPVATFMGVRNEAGALSAHAWVVAGGITVSGGAEQRRFQPVACFTWSGRRGEGD